MDVKNFPHLKFQSTEFIDLADAEALIDGVKIPLHSHVLAKSSKVFAQLFSSFREDNTGNRGVPTSLTELFAGESLKGVLLLLLMLYHRETVKTIIRYQTWGEKNKHAPEPVLYPREQMPPALLQSAARLADKLDCHYIIEELGNDTDFIYSDPLGWVVESRALKLHKITAAALKHLVSRLSYRSNEGTSEYSAPIRFDNEWACDVRDCVKLLQDKRWLKLDQLTYSLILEARTLFNLQGHRNHETDEIRFTRGSLENYAAPGDLVDFEFPVDDWTTWATREAVGVEQQHLDALPELQEEQAAEDFDEEWNDQEPEVIDD